MWEEYIRNGHYNLVKLNLYNNEVVEHLFGAVKMWIEKWGIDAVQNNSYAVFMEGGTNFRKVIIRAETLIYRVIVGGITI